MFVIKGEFGMAMGGKESGLRLCYTNDKGAYLRFLSKGYWDHFDMKIA